MFTYIFLLLQVLFKWHLYSFSVMDTLCLIFNGKALKRGDVFTKRLSKMDVLLERSKVGISPVLCVIYS